MSDTVQPASIQSELADILRRLTALETGSPNGMTLLASATGAQINGISQTTNLPIGSAATPTFTLTRPVPLLVLGLSSVGTGSNLTTTDFSCQVSVSGIFSAPLQSVFATRPVDAGNIEIIVPVSSFLVCTPSQALIDARSGSFAAQWRGLNNETDFASFGPWSLYVFQLSG
jgi:hypothetical protein